MFISPIYRIIEFINGLLDGKLSTFRENTNGANGLDIDDKGNLYACEGGGRKISKIDPSGNVTVLCDNYKGKKFNAPTTCGGIKKAAYISPTPDTKKANRNWTAVTFFICPRTRKSRLLLSRI